jgi:uncharacterized protein (TIGR03083 family)
MARATAVQQGSAQAAVAPARPHRFLSPHLRQVAGLWKNSDMSDAMKAKVSAFEQTVRSTLRLSATLETADWDRPTECPGWTVKDQVAHLVGVERMLLGDAQPDHRLPAELPHVRNDFGRLMEVAVDVRRPLPGPLIAAELAEVLERRLAALRAADPERQVMCPDGRMGNYVRFMAFRALDCWVHEQDIRRAVGRPGNQDAPAAYCLWDLLGDGLRTVVAERARARPGQIAAFSISGALCFQSTVLVSEGGQVTVTSDPAPDATVTLGMTWETYVRLATGRCGPDTAAVDIAGDANLAARILSQMALTP